MESDLYELFNQAQQGSKTAKYEIYNKFLPCIKGYGRRLFYEEAETDLTIFLLEFINKFDIKKFVNRTDGEIVNYMKKAFKCMYINIVKQLVNKKILTTTLYDEILCYDHYGGLEEDDVFSLLKNLNATQRNIIIGKYKYGYTDNELASLLSVSRQTISKQKNKAKEIIRKNQLLEEEYYGGTAV